MGFLVENIMKIVGITGGIGSGKSTISNSFKEFGFPVFDCDSAVKELYEDDTFAENLVLKFSGLWYLDYDKKIINKSYISNFLFSNELNRKEFMDFLDPYLIEKINVFIKKNSTKCIGFIESATLPNSSALIKLCSDIFYVYCPLDIRINRTIIRGNQNPDLIQKIIDIQPSELKYNDISNYKIINDGSKSILHQILWYIEQLYINYGFKY